jgi:methylmalonyl-CoA epimerase
MRVLRIRHLTIAVRDIDAAREAFSSLFGAEAAEGVDVSAFGARTQDLSLGASTLQLTSPRDPQGALQRFIERRGEGVYTVALEVDDIDGAVAELEVKGIRVSKPVESASGLRTAFVTMAATHGVSIQLVQDTHRAEAPPSLRRPPEELSSIGPADEPPAAPLEPMPSPKVELDLTPDEWSDLD